MMLLDAGRCPMREQPVEEYKLTLRRLAVRDDRYISALLSEERANVTLSGIDVKSHALLRIAALIALDAAPPSYMSAVEAGLEAGDAGSAVSVEVKRTGLAKCDRCWTYREDVIAEGERAGLCARCVEAMRGR